MQGDTKVLTILYLVNVFYGYLDVFLTDSTWNYIFLFNVYHNYYECLFCQQFTCTLFIVVANKERFFPYFLMSSRYFIVTFFYLFSYFPDSYLMCVLPISWYDAIVINKHTLPAKIASTQVNYTFPS